MSQNNFSDPPIMQVGQVWMCRNQGVRARITDTSALKVKAMLSMALGRRDALGEQEYNSHVIRHGGWKFDSRGMESDTFKEYDLVTLLYVRPA